MACLSFEGIVWIEMMFEFSFFFFLLGSTKFSNFANATAESIFLNSSTGFELRFPFIQRPATTGKKIVFRAASQIKFQSRTKLRERRKEKIERARKYKKSTCIRDRQFSRSFSDRNPTSVHQIFQPLIVSEISFTSHRAKKPLSYL